jgi:hypothetical protein
MIKTNKNQELIDNYTKLDLEILPEELRKNGFDYKLIKRENHKCIYSQSNNHSVVGYEVFKTKIMPHRARMIKLKEQTGRGNNPELLKEYKEIFPGDEEFGKRAWTFNNLGNALMVYQDL